MMMWASVLEVLNKELFGNSIRNYVIAISVFVLAFLVLSPLKVFLLHQLKKWSAGTKIRWGQFFISLIDKHSGWVIWLMTLYLGSRFIVFRDEIAHLAKSLFIILITIVAL